MDIKTDKLPSTVVPGARTASVPAPGTPLPESAGTAAVAEPAAKVRLSETARGQQRAAGATDVRGDAFDSELVRQIQERIDQGTFEINYDSVARELLQDAMAYAGKPKSGVTL